MKKTVARAAIAVIGLGIAGAGAAWFIATGNAIRHAEKMVAAANAYPLPQHGTLKLTYDTITRSNFPAVGVRLVNPVLAVNFPVDAQGRPPIDITWKRDGTLDVVTDYLANEYRISNEGADTIKIQSAQENVSLSTERTKANATITAKNRAAFIRWAGLDTDDSAAVRAALQDIASLQFTANPVVLKDTATGTVLMTQDASKINITNHSANNRINFDLNLAMNAMEAKPEYGATQSKILRIIQLPEAIWSNDMPFSSSRAGKQDIIVSMSANLPDDAKNPDQTGFVNVPTFLVKNNYYSISMPLHLEMKEENAQQLTSIKTELSITGTAAGAAEIQRALAMLDTKQGLGSVAAQLAGAPADSVIDTEVLKQKITEALPTLSTLGPITLSIDLDASLPNDKAPNALTQPTAETAKAESLTIRTLKFDHARWGVSATGMAARTDGEEPTIDLNIVCKKCNGMTKDIYDTASSAQAALNFVNPTREQWPINEALLTGINGALADIGRTDATTGDITFGVNSPSAGDYRINDQTLDEIMPKLMAIFMPLAAADQAPAAGAPIAPPSH